MTRHVIDTNVLIVASDEHPDSPFSSESHPVEEPAFSEIVLDCLIDFEGSPTHMVTDYDYAILGEYENKLTDQDLVLFRKKLKNTVTLHDCPSKLVLVWQPSLNAHKIVASCLP